MADRITAAVDMASEGGATLSGAAKAASPSKATGDAQPTQDGADADPGTDQPPPGQVTPDPPALHSGHKLARRYRLEECLTRSDCFSSWRAVDEMLRRAVGVHILSARHERAKNVLSAARSAALLGDPRFVQVLDAVEDDQLVYVVHEWLPDAVELTTVLAQGPLSAHDADQLVRQLSEAMAAAHRGGLHHLKLDPHCVLRTEGGQYRLRGLAVAAALHGLKSDAPKREDTEAIGALLYAALTQRWPYPEDAHGLTGLPKGLGLVAPDQVRAGVHRGLSELAMRALVNDGSTASREEPACATAEELAQALAAMPKVPPPEPEMPVYPAVGYPTPRYTAGGYRQPPARSPMAPSAAAAPLPPVPPPTLPGRTGKALKWAVSGLLIVALGLGSWQIARAFLQQDPPQDKGGSPGSAGEPGTGAKRRPSVPLKISGAQEFAPSRNPIAAEKVPRAVDGDKGTAWITSEYHGYANFGNLPDRKQGSGIIVDLGSVQNVTGIDIDMYRPGQTVAVMAADEAAQSPTVLSQFGQRLTQAAKVGGNLKATLDKPIRTRYVLIHVTELPPENADTYRGGITEISVLGEK